jgi:drug/metabolite transporter (DMT)-like permease
MGANRTHVDTPSHSALGTGSSTSGTFFPALGALGAFAANSLLCRQALGTGAIDPVSFTTLRLAAGALALALVGHRGRNAWAALGDSEGSWGSTVALLVYASCFSMAYVELPAGTGALILFAAVQLTMIGGAVVEGERVDARTSGGLLLAMGGLVALLLPGMYAPSITRSLLMAVAGVAWGLYSLRGRTVANRDPVRATAGDFLRAAPLSLAASLAFPSSARITSFGVSLAILSGALASAGGYVLWHVVVRRLSASNAAAIQLLVPVLAAIAAVVILGERASFRLATSGLLVLGGISLVLSGGSRLTRACASGPAWRPRLSGILVERQASHGPSRQSPLGPHSQLDGDQCPSVRPDGRR